MRAIFAAGAVNEAGRARRASSLCHRRKRSPSRFFTSGGAALENSEVLLRGRSPRGSARHVIPTRRGSVARTSDPGLIRDSDLARQTVTCRASRPPPMLADRAGSSRCPHRRRSRPSRGLIREHLAQAAARASSRRNAGRSTAPSISPNPVPTSGTGIARADHHLAHHRRTLPTLPPITPRRASSACSSFSTCVPT